MTALTLLLPLLTTTGLLGCTHGKLVKGDDTAVGDGGADTAGDGGADTAGDGGGDTGSGPPPNVVVDLSGDAGGRVVGLANLASLDSAAFGFGAVSWTAVPVDGQAGFRVETLPVDAVEFELDPASFPGWKSALFMPFAFEDDNGDGLHDDTEVITGTSTTWLAWFEAPLPAALAALGFSEGWNALDLSATKGFPPAADLLHIPLFQSLVPRESLTLSGTWEASSPSIHEVGLALMPGSVIAGDAGVTDWFYDAPMAASWSATIKGPPPPDHKADIDGDGVTEAVEVPLSYHDLNHDGSMDPTTEPPLYAACSSGRVVLAWYVDPITALDQAWGWTMQGVGTGWLGLVNPSGTVELLDEDALSGLVMDESCALAATATAAPAGLPSLRARARPVLSPFSTAPRR